jgi:hypothetical protein
MNFAVSVQNPNSVSIPVTDADYQLALGGVQVVNDKASVPGSLPAKASTTLTLPVHLTFASLLTAEQAIVKSGGDVPYQLDAGLDLPGGGGIPLMGQSPRVPFQYSGTLALRPILSNPSILLQNPDAQRLAKEIFGNLAGFLSN